MRSQVEALLRAKQLDRTLAPPADATLTADEREARLLASGWASVDRALGGGFPRGECSEIVGSSSSGRTALLMTLLAEATRRGEIVALVDAFDRFDPRAAVEMTANDQVANSQDADSKVANNQLAHAVPLDLSRLLWVRGTPLSPQALDASRPRRTLRRANRANRASQAPARTGPPRWDDRDEDDPRELVARVIDRALKAFGLIAQAGGFGVVALDFAEAPMTALRRLPFTTWFRLQRLIEGQQTVGIVLAPEPVGRSARGVTVQLGAKDVTRVIWTGAHDCARVLTGFALQPRVQAARRLGDRLRDAASA